MVQRAGPVEAEDAVGDHLGPDPQAEPTAQRGQRRVRYAADAELQGRAVGHQSGDPLADRRRDRSGRPGRRAGERLLCLDREVDVVD